MADNTTTFWTPERSAVLAKAYKNLVEHSVYPQAAPALKDLEMHDHLLIDTLIHYGCGLLPKKDYQLFLIPYETGQIFYKPGGNKSYAFSDIESKPNNSFFGSTTVTQKSSYLFITQRPLEAMLLWQKYGQYHGHDVISFLGPPAMLTNPQYEWLIHELLGVKWKRIYYVTSMAEIESAKTSACLEACIDTIPFAPEFYMMVIDYLTKDEFITIKDLLLNDNAVDIFQHLLDKTPPFERTLAGLGI